MYSNMLPWVGAAAHSNICIYMYIYIHNIYIFAPVPNLGVIAYKAHASFRRDKRKNNRGKNATSLHHQNTK